MIEFVNKNNGLHFWVSEDRVEEYKAAGHKPAAVSLPEKAAKRRQTKHTEK
jgi:hypothetical protein